MTAVPRLQVFYVLLISAEHTYSCNANV